MAEYLNYVRILFTELISFQTQVFDKLEAWGILLAVFFVFTAARLLIVPIVGGFISAGASDVVHRVNKTGRHAPKPARRGGKNSG